MIDKLRLLLQPEVDTGLKLAAVATFFAKAFESTYSRLTDLEARQLEKGDKGDKGDPPTAGEIRGAIHNGLQKYLSEEQSDLKVLLARTWDKW